MARSRLAEPDAPKRPWPVCPISSPIGKAMTKATSSAQPE